MIPYFDLHCDTLGVAFDKGLSLYSESLQASLSHSDSFSTYIQVGAFWSDYRYDNEECYVRYKKALNHARVQSIKEVKNHEDLKTGGYILAIEDARIINGNLSRIYSLKNDGVKIITPMWKGENILGGAWDTSVGLSSFGTEAIKESLLCSIIIDVSHASEKSFYQIAELTQNHSKSLIASHSNSYSVCPHKRNLTDKQFDVIKEKNGIVGISLVPQHLSLERADISSFLSHIYHFLSLGGKDIISIGCDFDGTDSLPDGINGVSDIPKLYQSVENEFGRITANKIFYQNAFNFFIRNT